MSEEKFLDQSGVQYLWSKVNMQDYPNNDILVKVIDAIDQTKQDKITGSENQFVVIDADGNPIAKTITPQIDNTLSKANVAADAKAVGDALAEKQPIGDYALKSDIPTVHDWATATTKPTYTASEVGADARGTASTVVSKHNISTDAHNDIRLLVEGLTTRLNTLADSDDTTLDQMSEIVAYIKSNKSLIEDITTNKVNVSDIINNLTTNVANKPLSAAQGVALKALIDAITVPSKLSDLTGDTTHRLVTDAEKSAWNAKSNFSGNYNDLTNKPTIPTVPTNVSAFTNDKGYLTSYTETDPTVPAWAKASTKPTYTASEVGASPVNHASSNTTYGIGTPDEYGHVKAAFAEKLLHWGSKDEGQDPDLWYDYEGNLIGDGKAAQTYLEGVVPNMWFMTLLNDIVSLNVEETDKEIIAIRDVIRPITNEEVDEIFSAAGLILPAAEEVAF